MATVSNLRASPARPLASGDALVLEGVTRRFGALTAIDDVSLSVAAGERRAVIGANGAGKTTLFNVVTGDYPANAGRVRFFNDDVTGMPPYERIRMGLRRTYQSSLLFRDLTVRDNLFLAVRGVAPVPVARGLQQLSCLCLEPLIRSQRIPHNQLGPAHPGERE